jgi:hypothetical protein
MNKQKIPDMLLAKESKRKKDKVPIKCPNCPSEELNVEKTYMGVKTFIKGKAISKGAYPRKFLEARLICYECGYETRIKI